MGGPPPLFDSPLVQGFLPAKHGVLKSGLQQCQTVLSAKKTARLLIFKCRRANPSQQPFLLQQLTSFHSRTQLRMAPQLASYISSCSELQTYLHRYIRTYMHPYIHITRYNIIQPYRHTYIHTYICTYIHRYINTYIHASIHTDNHTTIHTYMHTYIHTYVHK